MAVWLLRPSQPASAWPRSLISAWTKEILLKLIGKLMVAGAVILTIAGPLSAADTLDQAAVEALSSALADEHHAEAFYVAVLKKFPEARPFVNIVDAERTHAAEIGSVMRAYGIEPAENRLIGNEAITAAVPTSLDDACAIGVKAEIDNRDLYDNKLIPAVGGHADIVALFRRLRDASQNNHLPAFQRCSEKRGGGPRGPKL